MAAPIVAKVVVQVATSKTFWRIVGVVLVAVVLLITMPFFMIASAGAMFSGGTGPGDGVEVDPDGNSNGGTNGPAPGQIPVKGGWVSPLGRPFTWGTYPDHSGGAIDLHAPSGTPVYAPAAGTIVDLSEGCGGQVLGVQVTASIVPTLAHLSQKVARDGQKVKAGQLIAYSGASGTCVDGAHLHFEVRTAGPHVWGSFTPTYAFMKKNGVEMGPCAWGCDLYPMG